MTQTQLLRKRMTRTMPPPFADTRSGRAPQSCGSHATDLAQSLRSLALRAHQAVKDQSGARGDHPVNSQTLRDLQAEIQRLQTQFESQGLEALAAYTAALGRQVRSRLG
jgi:hypothetical protein